MGRIFVVFAILVWSSCGIGTACPNAPAQAAAPAPALPPLLPTGGGPQPYYCMTADLPTTVGDLTPAQFAQRVQVCNTSCSYEPMSPGDPHSLLIPTACGPGWHDTQYLVQPPAVPKAAPGSPGVRLVDTSCKSLAPSKAPPAPVPAASPAA